MAEGNGPLIRWTQAEIDQALMLRKAGKSAGKIAAEMGRTRNSVIGIMQRNRDLFPLGMPGTPVRRKAAEAKAPAAPKAEVWTDEMIRRAARLWRTGATVPEIALAISMRERVVYHYVARRPRVFPERIKIKAITPGPLVTKAQPAPEAPDMRPVTLVDRTGGQCHFPLWDHFGDKPTAESLYCGGAVEGDGSYCAFHRRLMYQPRAVAAEKRRAA